MATTYVEMTQGTPTSQRKFTYSGWIKKCEVAASANQQIFSAGATSDSYYNGFRFLTGDAFHINMDSTGSSTWSLTTTRLFRDTTAWYHIVVAIDTTQSVEADRMKLYINGVQETSFSETYYPTLNWDFGFMASGDKIALGREMSGSNQYYNGDMSHIVFVDGLQLAASYFGETDATSGIWKFKTPDVSSYGTNGFYLKMEDSSNMDLDSSGNAQTFTTTGNLTATKDNPANNFTTLNHLDNYYQSATLTNGNNTVATHSGNMAFTTSIFGLSAGLWYWEIDVDTSGGHDMIGISQVLADATGNYLGEDSGQYAYYNVSGNIYTNGVGGAYGDTYTTGDIIGVYLDLTASKLYFAKNGTIQNSGTGYSITAVGSTTNGFYFPALGDWNASGSSTYKVNFGNGYFGTDLISSPQDDAGGIGQFKYDPSTGTFDSGSKDFRAICTKNIKAYGG